MSDVIFRFEIKRGVTFSKAEPWNVTLVDTGDNSMTGGRLGRVGDYLMVGLLFYLW